MMSDISFPVLTGGDCAFLGEGFFSGVAGLAGLAGGLRGAVVFLLSGKLRQIKLITQCQILSSALSYLLTIFIFNNPFMYLYMLPK